MTGKKAQDEKVRTAVMSRYERVATEGKSCCEARTTQNEIVKIYSEEDLAAMPDDLKASNCGCGNPVAIGALKPGQVVLDLGSGAGLDVFLASERVGPSGKVIGVDATRQMVLKANKMADELGLENVEFRKGVIEDLPVGSDSVDVIISNCVINLVTDKGKVFREAYRVLKPGGKLAVSDRVLVRELPEKAKGNLELWSACVSGALPEEEYLSEIKRAGFVRVKVTDQRLYSEKEARSFVKAVIENAKGKEIKKLDEETAVQAFLAVANDRIFAFKPAK